MRINVMMTSGDVDEWEDAEDGQIDESGLLTVLGAPETVEVEGESQQMMPVVARYAPGMWMKIEYDQ